MGLVSLTLVLAERFDADLAKPVLCFYLSQLSFEHSTHVGLGSIEHSHPAFTYHPDG